MSLINHLSSLWYIIWRSSYSTLSLGACYGLSVFIQFNRQLPITRCMSCISTIFDIYVYSQVALINLMDPEWCWFLLKESSSQRRYDSLPFSTTVRLDPVFVLPNGPDKPSLHVATLSEIARFELHIHWFAAFHWPFGSVCSAPPRFERRYLPKYTTSRAFWIVAPRDQP
jgi:hypothetical protein